MISPRQFHSSVDVVMLIIAGHTDHDEAAIGAA
jgi:hypothetical protein